MADYGVVYWKNRQILATLFDHFKHSFTVNPTVLVVTNRFAWGVVRPIDLVIGVGEVSFFSEKTGGNRQGKDVCDQLTLEEFRRRIKVRSLADPSISCINEFNTYSISSVLMVCQKKNS